MVIRMGNAARTFFETTAQPDSADGILATQIQTAAASKQQQVCLKYMVQGLWNMMKTINVVRIS